MSARVSRGQCATCNCSPGLLSRNRRSTLLSQRINIKRTGSNNAVVGSRVGSRKASIFTIDASNLCVSEGADVKEINTSKRLEALRKTMADYNLGVYIVPSEDQHQSEYVSALDQKRSFISGFSGSAGVAIVTRDLTCMNDVPEGLAALSTDGRYFNQATNELDFNWKLLKQGVKDEPSWEDWAISQAIRSSLDSGSKCNIGVDPTKISYKAIQKFNTLIDSALKKYADKKTKPEIELVAITDNLIDKIWKQFESLPPTPANPIFALEDKFTGESVKSKLERLKAKVFENNIEGLVVTALDEVAWLLNLRGLDIDYNPVFYAFMILTKNDGDHLFIDYSRLPESVTADLALNNIKVQPYTKFYSSLLALSKDFNLSNKSFFTPDNASWEVVRSLKCNYTQGFSPVELFKSIKNKTEIQGAKDAHLKDGRALVKFFAWLEHELIVKGELIDECEADDKLSQFRKEEKNFVGLSFPTISASGANGAIIHYSPSKGSCAMVDPSKIYLNDSGSQFLEGTTDTTRTVHFETPSANEIKNYTLVLKGNIGLSTLKFPENTTGNLIDSIARQNLWKHGLDYGHGTSHGVGAFLNVHEGPIGIGPRPNAAIHKLQPGQLLSNEPGYYEDGEYGIRIENVFVIKSADVAYKGREFYEFETITRVPYCRKLIDVSLLTEEEINWVNEYHATIWNELKDSFHSSSYTYKWLKRETAKLRK